MELNEKIESYIDEFYVLYKYDVKSIFKSMNKDISTKEKMKKLDDKQIKNLIKFFDSFLFIIDYSFLDGKGLLFAFENYDYNATPSYRRVHIVTTLLENEIINIEEIMNNENLTDKQLIYEMELPMIKNIDDKEAIYKRVPMIPEIYSYCEKALSEMCYINLKKLTFTHLFDFQKDCLKVLKKVNKMDNEEQKKELLYCFANSSISNKDILLSDPILQNYSFDSNNGDNWKNIYDLLKETVL